MYLAELEGMLFAGKLEVSADEDEHSGADAGGLAIDGGDGMLALVEGKGSELGDDVVGALDLLAFEGKHGSLLIEIAEIVSIGIEG